MRTPCHQRFDTMRIHTPGLTVLVLLAGVVLNVSTGRSVGAQQAPPPRPAADQPPITFKVEVNYVEIDAIVTDQQGNFVRTLTKDDFQVLEQGKPQTVSIASLVDIPVEKFDPPLFKTKPVEPDVRSNSEEFNGRVFVLVLDDLNTSFSRSARVKLAARQFIERYLGANDVAAIVQTGGAKATGQEFTGSRERLLRAVNNFMGQKERSGTLERIDEYYRTLGTGMTGRPRDPNESIRVYKARNTYSTLKSVADYMAGIRGRRKSVVFFSEGIDYDIYDPIGNTWASDIRQYSQDAIAAATRANVSFYSVDPRGLAGFDDVAEIGSLPNDPSVGLGLSALQRELQISQDSLRVLSDETGGFAAVNSNDFAKSFERIIRDNSSYYLLGYYSNDSKRDGQFRTLTVRVKQPGLEVRARKGYAAARGRAPAGTPAPAGIAASVAMREALDSPVPVTGLAMRAFAAPMAGTMGARPKASVLVVVELDGRALKFTQVDGQTLNPKQNGAFFANNVEVAILAMDEGGKIRDSAKDTAELKLRPETHASVLKNGVRLTRRLELPPGSYQLRIGARESGGGLVGSVMYDLDVPDFGKADLSMGGILLTAASASRIPTANPDPDFKDILPSSPTAVRAFPPNDQLTLAVDVYDNKAATPHRVEIRTSVTADDGTVVFSSKDERRSEELKGVNGTFGHVTTIPLKGMAAGRYVLRVEAQSLLSGGPTTARELEFTVR
jgi:VWFA-related protein